MRKPIRYFLAGVICFVIIYACLWLAGFLIERAFKGAIGGSDILGATDSISPNQQYVATTFTDMGGGAAGWCFRGVTLRKSDQQFDPNKNRVFNIQCNTEVTIAWRDERTVLISFSTDAESVSLDQQSWSDDKTIRILYDGKTKGTPALSNW